jgi:hypothetical protein
MINHVTQEHPYQGRNKKRKHYRQPRLLTYGAVTELTASGTASGMEGTGKGNKGKRP